MDVGAFFTDPVATYFEYSGVLIDRKELAVITNTFIQRLGQRIGIVLAEYVISHPDADDALSALAAKYAQGI